MTQQQKFTSIDLFAGGGGASEGIRRAMGVGPLLAVNHDPAAIEMHAANHPGTMHLTESVFDVTPFSPGNKSIDLLWASPDCTFFSRARGGKPVNKEIRSLAWAVEKWAKWAQPSVICIENVPEFKQWGPLDKNNRPIKARRGETFRKFVAAIEACGYDVEWRDLVAADYGAPTSRKRFFLIARSDGEDIVWPEPTHGPGRAEPFRTASECIDWSIPALSIFATKEEAKAFAKKHKCGIPKRPLADKTLKRIAEGLRKYVYEAEKPFILTHGHLTPVDADPFVLSIDNQSSSDASCVRSVHDDLSTITTKARHALITASLIQTRNGERKGQRPRTMDIQAPLNTITATGSQGALVQTFLTKYYSSGNATQSIHEPLHTIVTKARFGMVQAFLTKWYGTSTGSDLNDPMPTVTADGGHLGLVTIKGEQYAITDITLRMLQPRELARAQGFDDDYILTGNKAEKTARIGNSVPPPVVEAIVNAQFNQPAVFESMVA